MKTKGKTKLKDLEVTKVDAVDIGADQKANILIKKRGGEEEGEGKENFFKRFFNAFCSSLGLESEEVRKNMDEATTFNDVMDEKQTYAVRDQIWDVCNSLQQSIVSIVLDKECEDKESAIIQSVNQFKEFADTASKSWSELQKAETDKEEVQTADDFEIQKMKDMIEKSCKKETENEELEVKKEDDMLDLTNMTEVEKRAALQQLQDDLNKEETKKRAEAETSINEQVQKAVNTAMEGVTKNFSNMMEKIMEPIQKRAEEAEEKALTEVAKKYEILGTKAEDLVPVLKSLKETSEEAYNGFVASMDTNVDAIQKSGLFVEIGKSGGAHTGNDEAEAIAKMNTMTAEIKKSMPSLSDAQAQDLVMQNNPEMRKLFDK